MRVVVADDAAELRQLVTLALDRAGGFDVVGQAGDGAEAVLLCATQQPDVVLLDLAMPVLDGLSAIPDIRRQSPGTRIVVLSGFAADQLAEEALGRGASLYLEKTGSPGEVVEALRGVCGLEPPARGAPVAERADPPSATSVTEVRRSLEELSSLVESTSESVIGKDLDGTIRRWNAGSAAMYGWTAEEVLGRSIRVVVPPERHDEVADVLARVAAGERVERRTVRMRKDGTRLAVWLVVSPIRDASGQVVAASSFSRDVSAEVAAEDELRRSRDELAATVGELRRRNEELGQFVYVASHDLAEPLRVISGFAELLQEALGDDLPDDAREYLGFISSGTRRMRQLLDDLLTYARLGAGAGSPSAVDLTEVVADACAGLALVVAERGARISIDGELPVVVGHRTQLLQLFQNLLGNALKFCPPDRTPEIRVDAAAQGRRWLLRIIDNGIGVAPEHRDRVFRMFQRLHTREEFEGTGIGLAICRRIVELHGGTIGIVDREEQDGGGPGAVVWFTLAREPES